MAMSVDKFSSLVFRVFMVTINNKNDKMTEASALVSLLLASAVVITWRSGLSLNSQQVVFICPLYTSYKSKTSH